jgi:hypothetical protein
VRFTVHSKAKGPTKAERKRWDLFREIGCVYCRIFLGHRGMDADVGHILDDGARRAGHDVTVPSCPWHHRGVLPAGCPDVKTAVRDLGPSLTHGSVPFRQRFGSDAVILAFTNQLLEEVRHEGRGICKTRSGDA